MENMDKEAEVVALTASIDKEALVSEEKALSIVASAIVVVDQGSYDLAMANSKVCAEKIKIISGYYDPRIKQANDLHKGLLADKKGLVSPWEKIKDKLDDDSTKWYKVEEDKAKEAKIKADDAARKEAEDAQLRAAEALQKEGLTAAADMVLDAPVVAAKVEVVMPEKADGVSYRDVWSAEVVDFMTLVKAVAEGKATLGAIQANETYLGQWARMSKGTESLPGVKVTNTPIQTRRL